MSKDYKERYIIAVFLRIIMLNIAFVSSLDMLAFLLWKLYIKIKYSSLILKIISEILLWFCYQDKIYDNCSFTIK